MIQHFASLRRKAAVKPKHSAKATERNASHKSGYHQFFIQTGFPSVVIFWLCALA